MAEKESSIWVWADGRDVWREKGQWTKTISQNPADIVEVLPAQSGHKSAGGVFFGGAGHGINQTPSSPPAPAEPSYEQKLWDEAALRMLGGLQPSAEAASKTADDFMAERAKRMVK
jgi:hypothetical protein